MTHSVGVLAAATCLAVAFGSGFAASLPVSPGPSTIHTAMAGATAGDTLLLFPGTYSISTSIVIKPGVSVVSTAGPWMTVVDMQHNEGSVFRLSNSAEESTIRGLMILRGAQGPTETGAGIYSIAAHPRIENNIFIANVASNFEGGGGRGGAIAVLGGSAIVTNNTIVANLATQGAVALLFTSGNVLNNIIAYNGLDASFPGAGVYCEGSSSIVIENNIFWENRAPSPMHECPGGTNFAIDPLFCAPVQFGISGDWRVALNSPVASGHSHHGIGAEPNTCGAVPAQKSTWGSLKATYR